LSTISIDTLRSRATPERVRSRTSVPRPIALAVVVILAAVLRFANLAALGYANHYYTAGVASMLQSWHNFFFVAAEPGGSVSIDKPPVGLWLQAISAYIFGVNGFGVLLPQILAGILSVIVLYHLVRRWFGMGAGLLAALALAITPVVVATDRNNTMDSTLILMLLLATWAFIQATECGKLRHLLLGAALVGIGFNIKMLQAFLPLPAFYALYLLGAKAGLGRKLANLALASILLLAISLSWAVIVDLTPADQRPYVGSSGNNSVLNLMLGYNGVERLTGMGGHGGFFSSLFGGDGDGMNRGFPQRGGAGAPGSRASSIFPQQGTDDANGGFPQPGTGGTDGRLPPPGVNGGFPGGGSGPRSGFSGGGPAPQGGFRGGLGGTGQAGPLRLFTTPLSKEVSWLLPFGLFSAVLLAFRTRLHWPLARYQRATLLWGGWLLTGAVFFSVAGFFHEYYLSMLAPPLAALVAIGAVELWRIGEERLWLAIGLLLLAVGGTLGLQIATAQAFVGHVWWLAIGIVLFVVGAVLLVAVASCRLRRIMRAGFITVITALLITPGIWSALTTMNSSANQSLPSAYSGQPSGPANGGDVRVNWALLDYLEANTRDTKYLIAVPSSMQGSDYVLATGRPVLYLGGFMGRDQVTTGDDLARMVAAGELRYIYWNKGGGNGFGGGGDSQSSISAWVTSSCMAIEDFDTVTQNAGAPDGTSGVGGPGDMQVTLYYCES
jgi:4-amino-4-deoxy-L-arabinose transferase-like glycosyltransferase